MHAAPSQAPIVGGNVSLYNEGATGPIYPTPVIGMVGRLPDARRAARLGFARPGDEIALVGAPRPSLEASELAKLLGWPLPDGLPAADIAAVAATHAAVRDAVRAGSLSSVHDIAEGGLAVALAECCLEGGIGAQVELSEALWEALAPGEPSASRMPAAPGESSAIGAAPATPATVALATALFGEAPGGFIVSGEAAAVHALSEHVPLVAIGRVGDDVLSIVEAGATAGTMLTVTLDELAAAHASLAQLFV